MERRRLTKQQFRFRCGVFSGAHGMDFLLTWNLRHIANAEQRPLVERACRVADTGTGDLHAR